MALAIKNLTITDEEGNVVSGATVTVRNEVTGRLARLFSDRDGTDQISNPFTAGDDGHVQFHVQGGAYSILAQKGNYERQWRYEPVGTAQEVDVETLAAFLETGTVSFRTKDDLDLFVPEPGQYMLGAVQADPDPSLNGYYTWDAVGEEWEFARPFPETLARLVNINGTANARTADAFANTASGAVTAFFGFIDEANTGPMTLSINGEGARPVVNAAGNPLSSGEFQGGVLFFLNDDGDYQLINDAGAAVAAAQSASDAGGSAAAAAGYAAGLNLPPIQPGDAGKQLFVKEDETGYELEDPEQGVDKLFTDDLTAEFDANEKAQARANIGAAPLRGPKVPDFPFAWMAHRGATMYNPEETVASYSDCLARGFPMIEMDARLSSDGNVVLMHDPTVNSQTNGSGNVADKTIAELKALGVLGFGSALGDGHPPATLSEVCEAFRDRAVFVIEGKVDGVIPKIMATLRAHGIQKDQAIIADFQIERLAPAVIEGHITEALIDYTTNVGDAETFVSDVFSAGVGRIGTDHRSSEAVIEELVGSGLPVAAYTISRRYDRDRVVGLGVAGIYTNDPVYLASDEPIYTEDQFHLQTWLPGMIAVNGSREAQWRGQFFGGDGWGWPEVVDVGDGTGGLSNRWVLQGWACPTVEDPDTDTFSVEFSATISNASQDTRWLGLYLADKSYGDRQIRNHLDTSTADEKGYNFVARKNGALDIFRMDGSYSTTSLGTASTPAIDYNAPAHFRVTVSPTTITLARLDGPGGAVTHSVSANDTTYRGAYFHLGVDRLAAKFTNVKVIAL